MNPRVSLTEKGVICGEKTKREQIIEKDQQIAFKY